MPNAPARQRVLLTVEQRFDQTPDGRVWTSGHYPYSFLERYLADGREVVLLARVRDVQHRPERARQTSGPSLLLARLPYYRGPLEFLGCAMSVLWAVFRAARSADAIVVRVPSGIGFVAAMIGRMRGVKVLAEVIGDPAEVFAPGHFDHPFRAVFRVLGTQMQRMACRCASASCYVSRSLASKYPSQGPTYVCASAAIPSEWFIPVPRENFSCGCLRVVAIGTMEVPYKRHDVLIRALAAATKQAAHVHISVELVGDGRLKADLERLAKSLGVSDLVAFHGFIADRTRLRAIIDEAHVMVHTSVTEGMPNVIIEAMARGLPCISTPVGGVPELLPAEWLTPVGDHLALSHKLIRLAQSPEVLEEMSARALDRSREFSSEMWQGRFACFMREFGSEEASES
jgi:glycosyltransferase involved in cell wall biosynthesis